MDKATVREASDSIERFNDATLRIEVARELVTVLGTLMGTCAQGHGELPVTGSAIDVAMCGVRLLLDDAYEALMGVTIQKGGAA